MNSVEMKHYLELCKMADQARNEGNVELHISIMQQIIELKRSVGNGSL